MTERIHTGPLLSRRFHLVLLHLAEEARRDLDSHAARNVRAIHSLRTRMKNLRALLLLVKPRIPKAERKAVATLAGKLKDAFSEQRDAYVVAILCAKFPGLRDSAAKGKVTPQNAARDRAAKVNGSRLIRMVSKLGLHGLTWADVIGGYLQSYRAGRKAMKECKREETAKAFHEWRRPVKELFYQSQVLQPLDGMKHRRNAAERLGDRLGELNDLHMLHIRAKKSRSADAAKHIAKKQRALRPAIFKAGKKLFGERPNQIERTLKRCVKFQPTITAQAVRQT
ncbi:MAG: CHAD domain-containing protein [Chthoniobacteraceae bacterium]